MIAAPLPDAPLTGKPVVPIVRPAPIPHGSPRMWVTCWPRNTPECRKVKT